MKNRNLWLRTGFALSGLRAATAHERSFRLQLLLCAGWFALLAVLKPALSWWVISVVMASVVMCAELVNTAIEHLADHVCPELHPGIKRVKDCAAAAVFVAACASAAVAAATLWSLRGG